MTHRNLPRYSTTLQQREPELIGKHKGECQGDVFYIRGGMWAMRRCSKCGQDGRHGTASPEID